MKRYFPLLFLAGLLMHTLCPLCVQASTLAPIDTCKDCKKK